VCTQPPVLNGQYRGICRWYETSQCVLSHIQRAFSKEVTVDRSTVTRYTEQERCENNTMRDIVEIWEMNRARNQRSCNLLL
jgi:hypothetical protein